MIDVITWKWSKPGYRSTFDGASVNVMRSMLERCLTLPHRLTCVTDDPTGIDPRVRIVDITKLPSYRFLKTPNPSSPVNPSCYVRLFLYAPEAADIFGERLVSVDLDIALTANVNALFGIHDDFAIWGGQTVQAGRGSLYNWFNGSLQIVKAGARSKVWTQFDPATSPKKAHMAGCRGSDQGWIAYCLGRQERILGTSDGVYSYRNHILPAGGRLPGNSRFVAFHGRHDPWHADVQAKHPWVREHYR